jgi:hypothetical protein
MTVKKADGLHSRLHESNWLSTTVMKLEEHYSRKPSHFRAVLSDIHQRNFELAQTVVMLPWRRSHQKL